MQPLSGIEYGGMLSDLVCVPFARAMLSPLAAGLDSVALASASDNVLDGYRAVACHLREQPGSEVLMVDAGLHPLGLHYALASTNPEGVCQSVSFYAGPDVSLPMGKLYTRGIRF